MGVMKTAIRYEDPHKSAVSQIYPQQDGGAADFCECSFQILKNIGSADLWKIVHVDKNDCTC